ncbi:MAG: hypothetical protein JXB45_12930 [Candidatus Krumholzibacteriota bacterium]|nr:hypothetical protein [Candidatus Krumholzibacteriota bacterium]
MKPPGLWQKYLLPVLLISGSTIVTLLAAELVLRLSAPLANIPQREYDPYLGWRGRSNLRCLLKEQSFSISIAQNSRGFRDRKRSLRGAPEVPRVLCTGDSFTWGWAVEQDLIYTSLLERRCLREGRRVEVINAGVGGYSTDQVLLYLQKEGFRYSPQVVIYQAARNDIQDNTRKRCEGLYHKPYFTLDDEGKLTLQGCPIPPFTLGQQLRYRLSRHSRLAYFLKHRLHLSLCSLSGKLREGGSSSATLPAITEADYPFRLFCSLIVKMQEECEARGARLLVLIDFPLEAERMNLWRRKCADVETHFVEGYLRDKEESHGSPAFLPHDGHWTENAHRWIADYLYANLFRDSIRPATFGAPDSDGLVR